MKILTRYVARELLLPLLLWLGLLFLLLVVMQLLRGTDVLLGSAVTVFDFLRLFGLLTPHFLVMAIPVAFLLAILLGLGRLTEDRELAALHSVGVSPLQILAVPLLAALALGAVMWGLASRADPWAQASLKRVVAEVIKKNVVGDVKPGLFYEDITALTLYAQKVDAKQGRWDNVLLYDDRDSRAPLLVLAHQGTVRSLESGASMLLQLDDGQVHRAENTGLDYTVIDFEHGLLNVGVGDSIIRQNRFSSIKDELTPEELLRAAREAPSREEALRLKVAFHGRLAQVWTPLAFALFGGALAMGRRQARGRSYLLAIVGYVSYYIVARAFENWGQLGLVAPWVSGQATNLIFCGVGCLALWRVTRQGTVW